ncbi:MAG: DUF2891 family protein [Myxococcota bacterium]|nr:DUF2891 family protein [Myxococcota bacterium]
MSEPLTRPLAPLETKRLLLKHLAVISTELRQEDNDEPLFHGCWDWHSAVHGHLAMLQGSRAMGWRAQTDWMLERLISAELSHVFARLDDALQFELPYGRAWFLRLLSALEPGQLPAAVVRQTDSLAAELLGWLEPQHLARGGREYQEPCFVLGALLSWWRATSEDELIERWRERIRAEVLPHPAALAADADQPGYFFSRWSLQAQVIQAALGDQALRAWIADHQMAPEPPVTTTHSVHHLGIHAARAVGYWAAFRATGDNRWRQQASAHIGAADALHTQWQGDRHAYSHWLPQFTVFAVLGSY